MSCLNFKLTNQNRSIFFFHSDICCNQVSVIPFEEFFLFQSYKEQNKSEIESDISKYHEKKSYEATKERNIEFIIEIINFRYSTENSNERGTKTRKYQITHIFYLFFSVEGTQKYPNTTATEVSHNLCTKSEQSVINLIVNIHYNNSQRVKSKRDMLEEKMRHTSTAIDIPNNLYKQLEIEDDTMNINQQKPLCRISFCLEDNFQHQIKVYKGMNVQTITSMVCQQINCSYEECVQNQIRIKLEQILEEGPSKNESSNSEKQTWRQSMKQILKISKYQGNDDNQSIITLMDPHRWYFQNNLKSTKNISHKYSKTNKKQNQTIYERCISLRDRKKSKQNQIKYERKLNQIKECTFQPKINQLNQSRQFYHSNNCKENAFQRLYKMAKDIKCRKEEKRRLVSQEKQNKILSLSFVPKINQCSREICRMRSHASLLDSSIKGSKEKSIDRTKNKSIQKEKEIPLKKRDINQMSSSSTTRIKLEKEQKKNPPLNLGKKSKSSRKKNYGEEIKKQIYIIDDFWQNQTNKKNERITPKKIKGVKTVESIQDSESYKQNYNKQKMVLNLSEYIEKQQKTNSRSQHLYNTRKKQIFSTIFDYLTKERTNKSSINRKKSIVTGNQIRKQDIIDNAFLPFQIKRILSPLSEEMDELGVGLNKEQFIWGVGKLYDDISVQEKGIILGWGVKLLPYK